MSYFKNKSIEEGNQEREYKMSHYSGRCSRCEKLFDRDELTEVYNPTEDLCPDCYKRMEEKYGDEKLLDSEV